MSVIVPILGALALVPAAAEPPAVGGSYELSVTAESGARTAATLTCGDTGRKPPAHPHRKRACKQLKTADGDIGAIPPTDAMCSTEHAPVTLRADGAWNGLPRLYERTFTNECVAVQQTGGYLFKLHPRTSTASTERSFLGSD